MTSEPSELNSNDQSCSRSKEGIFEFPATDLERAVKTFELFIQDSEIPREMMRIKSSNLVTQIQKRGLTQALALKLIEELISRKVLISGKRHVVLRIFTPLSGGAQTDEQIDEYRYLYFTRRRLRDFFAGQRKAITQDTNSPDDEGDPEYEFRKRGDFWLLRFKRQEIYQKDAVGLQYIRRLLEKPHQSFSAAWLYAERTEVDEKILEGTSGEYLDHTAIKNYKDRCSKLERELEQAQKYNDLCRQDRIQSEMEQLETELLRATGAFGNSRQQSDLEKIRKSVTAAAKRSIKNIYEHHKPLGSHLGKSISTGRFLSYAPESPCNWVT